MEKNSLTLIQKRNEEMTRARQEKEQQLGARKRLEETKKRLE